MCFLRAICLPTITFRNPLSLRSQLGQEAVARGHGSATGLNTTCSAVWPPCLRNRTRICPFRNPIFLWYLKGGYSFYVYVIHR